MNNIIYNTNSVNSLITEELLSMLDSRSRVDMLDFYGSIPFIQNLTNPNRKYAKDLPKLNDKIIVDITNPHILEDMDYFRQAAITFSRLGKYTELFPNRNPNSEYKKFWDEERRRCKEGMVRESDGEWIPGYYYFYLNYTQIQKVKVIEGDRAERVTDFPDVWDGDYLYFHYIEKAEVDGKHVSILKCRGRGYSYKAGSMAARNYSHIKASKSYLFASENEFLIKDGVMSKAVDSINFADSNTPFGSARNYKDTETHKRASYRDLKNGTEKGRMSEIMAITCKNDPSKGRGKRGKLLIFDESGSFPGLLKVWTVARKSVQQGKKAFGILASMGTGGEVGADFEAAEELFYHGEAYGVLTFPNVWDKNAGKGTCSMFIPEYLNREDCYDKNGNSDIVKALVETIKQREVIRNNSSDPNALVMERAESPITCQEAVLRTEGSIFPIADLKEYLADIMPSINNFVSSHYTGDLVYNAQGELIFKFNENKVPVREYPIKDNLNKEGCIEIFELPQRNADGIISSLRYIGGIDPVDDDTSTTNSLPSILILDRYTDRIVAEYTGRPKTAIEFYDICIRLLEFYNAVANNESDKKGIFAHFSNKNKLHLLCDTPQILKDKQMVKDVSLYGNKAKGTNSNKAVNAWGRRLQADWLVLPAYGEEETHKMNMHKVRSIGYLKELISWNPDMNADRISAMGMLMIYREDLAKFEIKQYSKKIKGKLDDGFFRRNEKSYANYPS
jgi:hypothetical protein